MVFIGDLNWFLTGANKIKNESGMSCADIFQILSDKILKILCKREAAMVPNLINH